MKKVKSYLIELTIVTIGVLIALLLNNFKESYQAKEYQKASLKTIENEVEANYSELKDIIEKQTGLLDTVKRYSKDHITIRELFAKANGLQTPTLSNTGLELYTRNQINSIDFRIMSTLVHMNKLSELNDTKLEKIIDFVYPNMFVDTKESKLMVILHLQNLLNSENQLLRLYQTFITEHVKKE